MLPDVDSLALFVRAAELRSLTKAAEASDIGLAAARRRIALLEHRFKTPLFARSPRGVDLTPAGRSLLDHPVELLVRMNQLQAEMRDHAAGRKGALRVLANTSAMTESLPDDLASFARDNPRRQAHRRRTMERRDRAPCWPPRPISESSSRACATRDWRRIGTAAIASLWWSLESTLWRAFETCTSPKVLDGIA